MRLYSHYSFLLHKHGYFTDYPPLRTDAKIRRNLYDCPLRDLFPPPYENSQRLTGRHPFFHHLYRYKKHYLGNSRSFGGGCRSSSFHLYQKQKT